MESTNQPLRGNSPSPSDLKSGTKCAQSMMNVIGLELYGSSWLISDETTQSMLETAASSSDCQDFIENSPIFRQTLDAFDTATCEEDMREPAAKLVQSVLDHFGLQEKRNVVAPPTTQIEQQKAIEIVETSVPICTIDDPEAEPPPVADLLITGTPGEFDYTDLHLHPWVTEDIETYTTCLTPIDINMKNCDMEDAELLCQAGVYASSCFKSQLHRTFVYALAINQEEVRLYYFDQCGALVTKWLSFREDPSVLIRMILLTCNPERDMVGLDPAVSFVPKPHPSDIQPGQQYERRISVDIGKGEMTLTVLNLMFSSDALLGRKTACWRVEDEQGNMYILKESSCLVDRTPTEWEVLEKVNAEAPDMTGVAKMVGHMECFKISDLHEKVSIDIPCGFPDRQRYYVLLECQGPPITHFKDPLQLLHAFRDAVAAHQKLWNLGILHRDISTHSILLGEEHASEGNRGVLANFDFATFLSQVTTPDAYGLDYPTTTHAFKSQLVLDNWDCAPHLQLLHDHLDDLESFFWVLFWITHSYKIHGTGTNVEVRRVPDERRSTFLLRFESTPSMAGPSKYFILSTGLLFQPSGWDSAIRGLLHDLRKFFDDRAGRKRRLQMWMNAARAPNGPQPKLPEWVEAERPLVALRNSEESKRDYETFLGYIDQAIADCGAGDRRASPAANVTDSPACIPTLA